MKIKKFFLTILLVFLLVSIFPKNTDLIVLMDSSGSILPWFDQIHGKILSDITKKFIRKGDVFHLISFNSRVNLEIVQAIQTETDVSRIVSRLMLLYPLGNNSDFLSGIQYAIQYGSTLSHDNNIVLLIITDGLFNPPETSPFAHFSSNEISNEIISFSNKIRNLGWQSYYIKLPYPENTAILLLEDLIKAESSSLDYITSKEIQDSLKKQEDAQVLREDFQEKQEEIQSEKKPVIDVSQHVTQSLQIEPNYFDPEDESTDFIKTVLSLPELSFPENLGKKTRNFVLPIKVTNTGNSTINLELIKIHSENIQVLKKRAFLTLGPKKTGTLNAHIVFPPSITKGHNTFNFNLVFSDNQRTMPQSGFVDVFITSFTLESFLSSGSSVFFTVILIGIIVLLVLIGLLVLLNKASGSVPILVKKTQEENNVEQTHVIATESTQIGKKLSQDTQTASSETALKTKILQKQIRSQQKEVLSTSQETAYKQDKHSSLQQLQEFTKISSLDRKAFLNSIAKTKLEVEKTQQVFAADDSDPIKVKNDHSITLELFVDNQNRHIGKRNIRTLKAGSRLSVGGKPSAFLIFLVKFPRNIAEARWDGENLSLALLKPQYFPLENSNIIENCINREFYIVSDKNYVVRFKLVKYEDPLQKLNTLLKSIMHVDEN